MPPSFLYIKTLEKSSKNSKKIFCSKKPKLNESFFDCQNEILARCLRKRAVVNEKHAMVLARLSP